MILRKLLPAIRVAAFACALSPLCALAEPRLVRVDGLSFYCPTCVQLNETDCQVLHAGEPVVVQCRKILDYLISQAALQGSDRPAADEVVNYLMRGDIQYQRGRQLMWLLVQSEEGRNQFVYHVRKFLRLYPKMLEELVNEGWGSRRIWSAIWEELTPDPENEDANLRAVLAVQSPERSLADLIDGLSVSNIVSDQVVLKTLEDKLRLLGSTWAVEVEDLRELLISCSAVGFDTSHPVCSEEKIESLEPDLQRYLKRVQVQQVLARIEEDSLDVHDKLSLLSSLPYQEFRTPETHQALESILLDIERGRAEIDWNRLQNTKVGEMLAEFAVYDPRLMEMMSRLISEDQRRIMRREQERREYERASLVLPKVKAGEAGSDFPTVAVLAAAVMLCSILAAVFAWRRFSVVEEKLPDETLTPIQYSELNSLRSYFGLDERATIEDIRKQYRRKARELHPDIAGGSAEQFAELNDKYRRSLELLGQRNINSRTLD